jgi:serpin B
MKWILSFFIAASLQAAPQQFAIDLAEAIDKPSDNWVFSPYSIANCLSLVAEGAEGATAAEIQNIMPPLSSMDTHPHLFQLHLAQGVWVHEGTQLLPGYVNLLHSISASIEAVPFNPQTVEAINQWISDRTENKITHLFNPSDLGPLTRIVLANALYFKGDWSHPFDPSETKDRPFHPSKNRTYATPSLHTQGRFDYYEDKEIQAVSLPFKADPADPIQPACLLILPKQDGMELSHLSVELIGHLHPQAVSIQVPKFTFDLRLSLLDALKKLGIHSAFSTQADFSKISNEKNLYLSDVLHKSYFSFSELGVEAAAATGAVFKVTSIYPKPAAIPFIADHPFYFLVYDRNSQTILFFGQVRDPQNE